MYLSDLSGFMHINYLLLCAILSPVLVAKDDIYSITVSVSQDSRQGVTGVVASKSSEAAIRWPSELQSSRAWLTSEGDICFQARPRDGWHDLVARRLSARSSPQLVAM